MRSLAPSEVLMVVVMEWCDMGSLASAIRKQRFRPHGKWPFKTTYVRHTRGGGPTGSSAVPWSCHLGLDANCCMCEHLNKLHASPYSACFFLDISDAGAACSESFEHMMRSSCYLTQAY